MLTATICTTSYLSMALRSFPPAAPLSTLAQVSTIACKASVCSVWAASPVTII